VTAFAPIASPKYLSLMAGLVRPWIKSPTRASIEIVNRVLKSQPGPLSTKEIYKLALEEKPSHLPRNIWSATSAPTGVGRQAPPQPPNPEHPIRSVRYLKTVVLKSLLSDQKVQKIHTTRTLSDTDLKQRLISMTKTARKTKTASLSAPVDAWLWRVRKNSSTRNGPEKIEEKEVFGADVGVGEDWSHLNKRRRRARLGKVTRAMIQLRKSLDTSSHVKGRLIT